MIGQLSCDVCGDTIKSIQRLGMLGADLQTAGKYEHLCPACKNKLDNQMEKLKKEADATIVSRAKEFIEGLANKA